MQITRITDTDYDVTTPTQLAAGGFLRDTCCRLQGRTLASHEQHGLIRIGGLLRVHLGPVALDRKSVV